MLKLTSEGVGDDAVDEELLRALRQRGHAADRGEAVVAEEQPQVNQARQQLAILKGIFVHVFRT